MLLLWLRLPKNVASLGLCQAHLRYPYDIQGHRDLLGLSNHIGSGACLALLYHRPGGTYIVHLKPKWMYPGSKSRFIQFESGVCSYICIFVIAKPLSPSQAQNCISDLQFKRLITCTWDVHVINLDSSTTTRGSASQSTHCLDTLCAMK